MFLINLWCSLILRTWADSGNVLVATLEGSRPWTVNTYKLISWGPLSLLTSFFLHCYSILACIAASHEAKHLLFTENHLLCIAKGLFLKLHMISWYIEIYSARYGQILWVHQLPRAPEASPNTFWLVHFNGRHSEFWSKNKEQIYLPKIILYNCIILKSNHLRFQADHSSGSPFSTGLENVYNSIDNFFLIVFIN